MIENFEYNERNKISYTYEYNHYNKIKKRSEKIKIYFFINKRMSDILKNNEINQYFGDANIEQFHLL